MHWLLFLWGISKTPSHASTFTLTSNTQNVLQLDATSDATLNLFHSCDCWPNEPSSDDKPGNMKELLHEEVKPPNRSFCSIRFTAVCYFNSFAVIYCGRSKTAFSVLCSNLNVSILHQVRSYYQLNNILKLTSWNNWVIIKATTLKKTFVC